MLEMIISTSERSGIANETIENVTLDPGKYFLSVEAFEGNTNYSLSLAGVAGTVAADLAGDRPSTARALPPDGELELHDYVGGADAVDAYRLEVLNPGYLDVFAENRKADLNLTVWSDRNGNNQLDADEIVAQGTNEIQEDNINPGTYYVNVTAPGAATPYKISAISEPGSRVDIENYDPLFPGIPKTGTLTQNDNFDPNDLENYADPYLIPELGAGLTVTVTQQSDDFDAYLRVVDLLRGEVTMCWLVVMPTVSTMPIRLMAKICSYCGTPGGMTIRLMPRRRKIRVLTLRMGLWQSPSIGF
jgi:hypothetical protein